MYRDRGVMTALLPFAVPSDHFGCNFGGHGDILNWPEILFTDGALADLLHGKELNW